MDSVTLGMFAAKLMARKGSIWVAKSKDVNAVDVHELTILLWIHVIIAIYWSTASVNKGGTKAKQSSFFLQEKPYWIRY